MFVSTYKMEPVVQHTLTLSTTETGAAAWTKIVMELVRSSAQVLAVTEPLPGPLVQVIIKLWFYI